MRARRAAVVFAFVCVAAFGNACRGGQDGGDAEDAGDAEVDASQTGSDAASENDSALEGDSGLESQPVCRRGAVWGSVTSVPSLPAVGSGAAVSASGLTVAWVTTNAKNRPILFYADRASVVDAFGPPRELTEQGDDAALAARPQVSRVALSGDGLRLIYVIEAGLGLVELSRETSAGAFGDPRPLDFGDGLPGAGTRVFADPVFRPSGDELILTVVGASETDTIHRATRSGSGWVVAGALDPGNAKLAPVEVGGALELRMPHALSSDGRTLFYFDPITGKDRVAWRPSESAAFESFDDLAAYPQAQPSAPCDRLYFTLPSDGGLNTLAYVDRQ